MLGRMISQTKTLKIKSFLSLNFVITKIYVMIRLVEDWTRMGGIQFRLSPRISCRTGVTFKIFHQLNCKSSYLINLLQCQIFRLQYVAKSGIQVYIKLINHGNESKNKNSILACKHNFQRNAKLTNWTNYENLYNYRTVTRKKTGRLLDS